MAKDWKCAEGQHRWSRIGTTAGGAVALERCERCKTERRRTLDDD